MLGLGPLRLGCRIEFLSGGFVTVPKWESQALLLMRWVLEKLPRAGGEYDAIPGGWWCCKVGPQHSTGLASSAQRE